MLDFPVRLIPGNHDNKPLLKSMLMREHTIHTPGDRLCWVEDLNGLRLIGLDTVIPGKHHGGVIPEMLAWLETELDRSAETPVIVCMHHPPVPLGISHMDHTPFEGAAAFADLLKGRDRVLRLLGGHAHRTMMQEFGGRPLFVAPSTAMQLELNLLHGAAANFMLEPGGLALHLLLDDWQKETALITHIASIPGDGNKYPGPHPFFDLVLPG